MVVSFDEHRLRAWLGASELAVDGGPAAGGWSNETVFVRADGRPLVLRLSPSGESMFPAYDLGLQVRCLRYAFEHGLPVPAIVGDEPDATVLGRPFFVMERLAGRVPADDDPPFTKAGFLFDADPAQQRRFCRAAIDAVAAVHAVPAPDFVPVGPAPRDHLAACASLSAWAGLDHPELTRAAAALAAGAPADGGAPVGLLWGDARPANMVVADDFRPVGLLDWELCGRGPGELDVAWFCEMNRMRSVGMGIEPLPGFLDDGATWDRWSAAVGRAPVDVAWHHRFAAYRVAVLLFLFLRSMTARGRLPAGHRLNRDNLATRRLHELFG